jgi:hypothetical protein
MKEQKTKTEPLVTIVKTKSCTLCNSKCEAYDLRGGPCGV